MDEKGPQMSEEFIKKMVKNIVYYTFQLMLELVPDVEEKMKIKLEDIKLEEAARKLEDALREGKLQRLTMLHEIKDDGTPGKRNQILVTAVINFLKEHSGRNPNLTLEGVLHEVNLPKKKE